MNIKEMQDNTNKFFGNQGQTTEIPDLTRIADAMEKIARELSRANELKALELRSQAGRDSDLERIDEIMED